VPPLRQRALDPVGQVRSFVGPESDPHPPKARDRSGRAR
jgi:hypothetical protein